jgi:hypothetical protein
MFKLAIDSKFRGCNPAPERPLCANSGHCRKVGFWHDRDMPASRRPEMARAPPKRRFLIHQRIY